MGELGRISKKHSDCFPLIAAFNGILAETKLIRQKARIDLGHL